MMKETFVAVGGSARGLLRGWAGLVVLGVLYALLLVCVYWFFATGVATTWQLALSGLTFVAAPLLFFVLQAAAAHFAAGATGPGALMLRALRDFWKVLLVSLPVAAVGYGLYYLLDKLQGYLPTPEAPRPPGPHAPPPAPLTWTETFSSSLWLLVLGFFLPLVAAHLWLAVARDGLRLTLRRYHRAVGRAFLPRPVLVYAAGLLVFGLMPYFIIYTRTPLKAASGELLVFGLRMALAFLFTLLGWTLTLGALHRLTPPADAAPAAEPPLEPSPEPPAAEPQLQS